jgi:tyrosyl-tRNA synthetase
MKGYLKEAGLILDVKKAEIHHNSDWHKKKGLAHILSVAQSATIQQVLKRDDFKKRIESDSDISLLELFYPVLQGYDSVAVGADVEIGGTDQKFNLLMGRRVQRHFGMEEQDILTVPLLEGTDGIKKMSKSVGNYIALGDEPNNMFGKIMTIPDTLLEKYYTLLTDERSDVSDPYTSKTHLAEIVTELYHGKKNAEKAKDFFVTTFSKKEISDEIPEIFIEKNFWDTTISGNTSTVFAIVKRIDPDMSNSEIRRLIEQGGLSIDKQKKQDPEEVIPKPKKDMLVKVGKKKFLKIRTK